LAIFDIPSNIAFMHLFNAGKDDELSTMHDKVHLCKISSVAKLFFSLFYHYTPHVASGSNIKQVPALNNL
jgi:hypothetical protein